MREFCVKPGQAHASVRGERSFTTISKGGLMNLPVNLFVVYASSSKEDESLCSQLLKHLKPLEQDGSISLRHVEQIRAGDQRLPALAAYLARADAVLLLYSADFVDSPLCHSLETLAVSRAKEGKTCVLPVLLRPCIWGERDIANLVPLPTNGRFITQWSNQDEAWTNVVQGVKEALIERRRGKTLAPMPRDARQQALRDSGMNLSSPSRPSSVPVQPARVLSPPAVFYAPPTRTAAHGSAPARGSNSTSTKRSGLFGRFVFLLLLAGLVGAAGWIFFFSGYLALSLPSSWLPKPASEPAPNAGISPTGLQANPTPPKTTTLPFLPNQPNNTAAKTPALLPTHTEGELSCSPACCGGDLCVANKENRAKTWSFCGKDTYCARCPSGRRCVEGLCSTTLAAGQNWQLRLAQLTSGNSVDYSPARQVCIRKHMNPGSVYACTNASNAATNPDASPDASMKTRLAVTTSDLLVDKGMDIWVYEGNEKIAESIGHAVGKTLQVTALCSGVVFRLPKSSNSTKWPVDSVSFYLDDP